jgi:ssDNA-specific exonuclease RecJ
MTVNEISGFLSVRLCISVFLIAGLLGTGAAQSYDNLYVSNAAPQTAQERAELFKAIQNMDEKSNTQTALDMTDLYKALQNPYLFKDPQAGLENANTYKQLQKQNGIYSSSRVEDNWYYWTNMWLNGPEEATGTGVENIYRTMSNPYAFRDPQAALENANTYKQLQKLNGIYSSSRVEDNWYYWTNMWLNEPST